MYRLYISQKIQDSLFFSAKIMKCNQCQKEFLEHSELKSHLNECPVTKNDNTTGDELIAVDMIIQSDEDHGEKIIILTE